MLIRKRTKACSRALRNAAIIGALGTSTPLYAQPAEDARSIAASEFDAGIKYFDNADYEAAARAFLRADVHAPNSEAIANAITAARRANNHLLVAEAAERGISRQSTDPGLAATARQALAEASRHLARVDLGCSPAPCDLLLDGSSVAPGPHYVLPGTHVFNASGPAGARAEDTQELAAGTTYRVVLRPTAPEAAAPNAPETATEATADEASPTGEDERVGLHPAWFYAGAALTTGLAAVSIWSGANALSAKGDLPDDPNEREIDSVRGKAIRTDVLFGATLLLGAATAYAGFELVNWGDRHSKSAVLVVPGGAMLSTRHSFQ